jgi:serine/threonine protein kinase
MPKNDNIVLIKELIREDDSQLHFVFEYMSDGNLYQLMKECIARRSNGSNPTAFSNHNRDVSCSDLTPDRIQSIVMQVLKGLEHTHSLGFIHRGKYMIIFQKPIYFIKS